MPLAPEETNPLDYAKFQPFPSRRSVVHSTEGMIACTQPLAARCGLKILDSGGNAADAAVAIEPASTGLGGDMFCLFYEAKTKKISALNGSGRTSIKSTLEATRTELGLRDGEHGLIPLNSVHAVTVPGAAAGWVDTIKNFGSGKLSLKQILTPAIELAENGFPVSEISSSLWRNCEKMLREASPNGKELLKSGSDGDHAPRPGEIFKNANLGKTFRTLAEDGIKGFYTGRIAEEIVKVIKNLGGFLELEDLEHHMEIGSEVLEPISYVFRGQGCTKNFKAPADRGLDQDENLEKDGIELWEHPPNGQGIVALMALGILEALEENGTISQFGKHQHNSVEYLHALIESLRIAFADASWWVSDPSQSKVPSTELISKKYLAERAKLFDPHQASKKIYDHGSPAHNHSDTVYFSVVDREGNAISFINSIFHSFGAGIIPQGTGFVLQNRGASFSLIPGHPNAIAPSKRPYHTIIPAMMTNANDGSLHSVYGVMGGFMQPQGHVQVLLNMIAFGHNPQTALDAPRFCIGAENIPGDGFGRKVMLEEGISEEVCEALRAMGHDTIILNDHKRSVFGRGQIIRSHVEDGVYVFSGGSDPRGDGAAFPG